MSYTIDVYKRRCKVETNPLRYTLFVASSPRSSPAPMSALPTQMPPQEFKSRRFSYNRCAGGAFRMLWGYTKKMVIADNLSQYVSFVYGNMSEMSGPNLFAATVLFAVQLYMDFSGCCDIVLGAARILGYDLIENFNSPFEARSFNDFWRRWHISMTGWFRDYVYFSLGGSRCAPWRHYLNIVIVFLCSGLWHGADWRYLAWGLACGLCAAFGAMTAKARKKLEKFNPLYRQAWLKAVWQVTITDLLFCVTLVFFAAALYNADPFAIYGSMLQGWNGLAGSWHQVQQMLLDCGIDGRLPVVLLSGTFVVLAVEHGGRSVTRWIREQVWPLPLDSTACRGRDLVLRGVRPVGVHLPAILTKGGALWLNPLPRSPRRRLFSAIPTARLRPSQRQSRKRRLKKRRKRRRDPLLWFCTA